MAIDTSMQIHGLVSGMDTETMVKDLMKVQQMKVDRVQQKKQIMEWQRDDYRDINTKLLALRNAAFDMTLPGTYQAKKVNSSDETILTATAGTAAAAANYSVNVISLASGVNKGSSAAISSGDKEGNLATQFGLSGTLNFTLTGFDGTKEVSKEFSFDTTTQKLGDVVNEINKAGLGMQASYDANLDRFFMASTGTGKDYKIVANSDSQDFLNGKLKLGLTAGGDTGTNAKIDFNGATGLEFSSNQFTISGINFNLKKAGASATLAVNNDTDAVVAKVKAFVETYNATMDLMGSKLNAKRNRDFPPLTEDQKKDMKDTDIKLWEDKAKSGLLQGDGMIRGIYNHIRSSAMETVTGLPTGSKYTSLSSIGITTGDWRDNGKLNLNEDKLRAALSADPQAVSNLFTQRSVSGEPQGVAVKLHDNIKTSISAIINKAGSNTGYYDNSVMGKQITEVDSEITTMQEHLQDIEARYWKQFNAMESALQRMNTQSQWLTQQFSSSSNN